MAPTPAPCLECRAMVRATATTCPECGYTVDRHDRWRLLLGATGMVLSLTVVFAPVGVPLLWRAHRHRLAAAGSVSHRGEAGLREQLGAVLRQSLGQSGPHGVDDPAARSGATGEP